MATLSLKHVYKVYDDGTVAVSDLNLDISDGEFLILVGPSGCGKSTTLRMIAGLEDITAGDFYIDETRANALEPKQRKMAMVFQNYALYPHMNVYENMAFGLRINHVNKIEIDDRVKKAAEILGLTSQLSKKPKDMSGGQKQRVALGRAIVRQPSVFLLDEPLSNLDAKLRASMRSEIRKLHDRLKTTFIYVTHDQVEAMTMGTKIVVMDKGCVQQVDSPMNLYDYPQNTFVAGFIGTPQMNFFNAISYVYDDYLTFSIGNTTLKTPISTFPKLDLLKLKKNSSVTFGVRPEHLHIMTPEDKDEGDCLRLEVNLVEALGNETICEGIISGTDISISTKIGRNDRINQGDVILLKLDFGKVQLFSKDDSMNLCPRVPSNIYLKLNDKKNLFNTSISLTDDANKLAKSAQKPYLSLPTSAIIPGNTYSAKIVSKERINGETLLCLSSKDKQYFYVSTTQEVNGNEFFFDIKNESVSLYDDFSLIFEAIPEISHLDGKLIPNKRSVLVNGKNKRKKVFDYQIENISYRPDDERVNRIYALLGKKFHLHDIDFSFSPCDITLSNDGLEAVVEKVYQYGKDRIFAKVKVNEQSAFIQINENIHEGDVVHFNLDPSCLKVRDKNFNVIIL